MRRAVEALGAGTGNVRPMGDLSNEPSMEEILSSIKRIIAEEGDHPPRARRGRPAPDEDGVLELSDPISVAPVERPIAPAAPERARVERTAVPIREPESEAHARRPAPRESPAAAEPAPAEPMVSAGTVEATRGALDHLSRLLVRPEPGADGTLEGLVREMLRPMLREWLDTNLPALVERIVAREIGRITGSQR